MQKLKVTAIGVMLKEVLSARFLLAPAQLVWLLLVAAADIALILSNPGEEDAAWTLAKLATLVLLLPVVVNTHRFLLKGEMPGAGARHAVPYLLALLGLWLPVLAVAVLMMMAITRIAGPLPVDDTAAPTMLLGLLTLAAFTAFLVGLFALVWPMSLVLPARALGDGRFHYRDGLSAAKGNIDRLIFLTLAVALILFVIALVGIFLSLMLYGFAEIFSPLLSQTLAALFAAVMDYVGAIIGATMLSFAYAGLVQRDARFLTPAAAAA